MILFFLALVFAAWTSLISMIELAVRVLVDAGASRGRAIVWVGIAGFILGVAVNLGVLLNQDFVWGVGLMLSGFFFAFAVVRYGLRRFRQELINRPESDLRIGWWWDVAIVLCLIQALALIVWWFAQAASGGVAKALDPFSSFSIGTVLLQWVPALLILVVLNRWLVQRSARGASVGSEEVAGRMPPSIP